MAELRTNPRQSEVLDAKRHCIALAGPGSGKTKTIAGKIAKLLREEIPSPRGIACITYSNECAEEIGSRLSYIGIERSARFYLGTVHGFCYKHIALPYGAICGMPIADRVATKSEQETLRRMALLQVGIEPSRDANDRFDELRREPLYRGPRWHLNKRVGPVWRERREEFGAAIEYYERELSARHKTDFNEMVRVAVTLIHRHTWLSDVLRAKFPVIVVDEYQDLGYGLHTLVTTLQDRGVRLIAVGDPDQSIYAFGGAKPETLQVLYEKHLATGEAIRLEKNYRCGRRIIDLSVAALGQERVFEAESTEHGLIEAYEVCGGIAKQAAYAVEVLLPKLEAEGIPRGEVGFLYPDRHVRNVLANDMMARGIAFRGARDQLYPKTPVTELIELSARWTIEGLSNANLRLSMVLNAWRQLLAIDLTSSVGRSARSAYVGYLWRNRAPETPLSVWLEGLCAAGINGRLEAVPEGERELLSLKSLLDTANRGKLRSWTLGDFANAQVRGMMPHLVTIHASKGLEYDAAIVIGMDSSDEASEEDRRKLYVALTRARRSVHLLWSGAVPSVLAELVGNGDLIPQRVE